MNSFSYYTHILQEEWRAIRDFVVEQKRLAILLLALFIALIIYLEPFPQTRIVIATGGADSTYMMETQAMVGYFKKKGIEVIMRETSGSLENAELLNDPDIYSGRRHQWKRLSSDQLARQYSIRTSMDFFSGSYSL
jgi:hypothetical protein